MIDKNCIVETKEIKTLIEHNPESPVWGVDREDLINVLLYEKNKKTLTGWEFVANMLFLKKSNCDNKDVARRCALLMNGYDSFIYRNFPHLYADKKDCEGIETLD